MTREALAEASGISGVALFYIEEGRNNPSVGTVERIATALGVSVSALFKEPPRKKRA